MLDFISLDESLANFTRRWSLTGFSRSNTDSGRLWIRCTDNGGSTTIELFTRPERNPGDLVGQGSGAPGSITITQANASGLSGNVELLENRSLEASLVTFYACDEDLDIYEENLSSLLDGSNNYAGQPGFEALTTLAKRRLDDMVIARLRREGLIDPSRAAILSSITDLDHLTEPAALLTLALLYERIAGAPDKEATQRADHFYRRFEKTLAASRLRFDFSGNGSASLTLLFGDITLIRG